VTSTRLAATASGRARPLPPDERRAAIVRAVLPVVREYGANVTTRQLARAAGVAEGTLFRVFPDKEAIMTAVVDHVVDPGPWVVAVTEVDPALPLRPRLRAAVAVLQDRLAGVFSIMMMIGRTQPERANRMRRPPPNDPDPIMAAVVDLLQPDAEKFRIDVDEVGRFLRLLVFAGTHVWIAEHRPMTPDEIVDLILDGVLTHPADTNHQGD
jgi:AcrR family transcriptional regulator